MKTQKTLLALAILITSLSFGQTNTLNATGNVGVGTTTPESTLHLNGPFSSINSKGIFAIESSDVYSSLYFGINSISPYIPFFQSVTRQNNNPYDLLINPRGGNIGIGTTSPAALLDLQKNYGNDVGIKLSQPGSSIWDIKNTATTGLFTIGAGGSNYFNIDKMTGNVGIGTTTPSERLVISNLNTSKLKLETTNSPSYYTSFETKYDANNTFNIIDGGVLKFGSKNVGMGTNDTYVNSYYGIGFATFSTDVASSTLRMYINQAGNVGIGTTTPTAKLDVNGDFNLKGIPCLSTDGISNYFKSNGALYFETSGTANLSILYNGNVGIGTTTPDEKLAVNGFIHAKEVRVDMLGWPDYVFASTYTLKPLASVAQYIKEKGHLPNVPSATEVEEKGLELSKMSKIQQEKIEELTLYLIQQNKEIEELKAEKENYKLLAERLTVLEKELKRIDRH